MSWITVATTAVGIVGGAGATLSVEHIRWRRTVADRVFQDRRDLYVDCIVTIRRAHEAMRGVVTDGQTSAELAAGVREAFRASGCDEARERMFLMDVSNEVEVAVTASYHTLREVREVLAHGHGLTSSEYNTAREAHGNATRAAREVLRRDLSADRR
ncbi:hypothetical protein ABZ027_15010 [Streptomyces sp. NPDC006332]|uniref:hypothetical protein n=1 Tax=Streptomyces sp. NPDC006332 TaxID=3155456 RepID=UPI0033A5AC5F